MAKRTRKGRKANGRRMPKPAGYHIDRREMVERPDGRPACRFCKGAVPKGRRRWCGDPRCQWEFSRRARWAITRRAVLLRDGGTCSRCGLDCEGLRRDYFRTLAEVCGLETAVGLAERWTPKVRPPETIVQAFARSSGQPACIFRNGGPFVEVDHITPLCEGGDAHDFTNLHLLCPACHRLKTKADGIARRTKGRLHVADRADAGARVSRRRAGDPGGGLPSLAG